MLLSCLPRPSHLHRRRRHALAGPSARIAVSPFARRPRLARLRIPSNRPSRPKSRPSTSLPSAMVGYACAGVRWLCRTPSQCSLLTSVLSSDSSLSWLPWSRHRRVLAERQVAGTHLYEWPVVPWCRAACCRGAAPRRSGARVPSRRCAPQRNPAAVARALEGARRRPILTCLAFVCRTGALLHSPGKRVTMGGYSSQDVAAHVYDAALVMKDGVDRKQSLKLSAPALKKLNFPDFWRSRTT